MDELLVNPLYLAVAVSLTYFTLWFGVAVIRRRYDIIDIAWGGAFIAIAWSLLAAYDDTRLFVQYLIVAMVSVWGGRLALHIYARNAHRPEDKRYVEMRRKWGKPLLLQIFLRMYMIQALLAVVVALPIVGIFSSGVNIESNLYLLGAGFAIWAGGLMIEIFADRQLGYFLRHNKNKHKVLDTGLWKYSRHPNYFGEVSLWWGLWLVVMSAQPLWWTAIGPLTITFLILFVSGVPMLERRYANDKAYQAYARRTSIFVPLPTKKSAKS